MIWRLFGFSIIVVTLLWDAALIALTLAGVRALWILTM